MCVLISVQEVCEEPHLIPLLCLFVYCCRDQCMSHAMNTTHTHTHTSLLNDIHSLLTEADGWSERAFQAHPHSMMCKLICLMKI